MIQPHWRGKSKRDTSNGSDACYASTTDGCSKACCEVSTTYVTGTQTMAVLAVVTDVYQWQAQGKQANPWTAHQSEPSFPMHNLLPAQEAAGSECAPASSVAARPHPSYMVLKASRSSRGSSAAHM